MAVKFSTFPKAFSQATTSQGYFPKRQLPKCAISQAATSQVCSRCSACHTPDVLVTTLGPYPNLDAVLAHPVACVAIWEVAVRKCPWKNSLAVCYKRNKFEYLMLVSIFIFLILCQILSLKQIFMIQGIVLVKCWSIYNIFILNSDGRGGGGLQLWNINIIKFRWQGRGVNCKMLIYLQCIHLKSGQGRWERLGKYIWL